VGAGVHDARCGCRRHSGLGNSRHGHWYGLAFAVVVHRRHQRGRGGFGVTGLARQIFATFTALAIAAAAAAAAAAFTFTPFSRCRTLGGGGRQGGFGRFVRGDGVGAFAGDGFVGTQLVGSAFAAVAATAAAAAATAFALTVG
jgi:hypothetical protein